MTDLKTKCKYYYGLTYKQCKYCCDRSDNKYKYCCVRSDNKSVNLAMALTLQDNVNTGCDRSDKQI